MRLHKDEYKAESINFISCKEKRQGYRSLDITVVTDKKNKKMSNK